METRYFYLALSTPTHLVWKLDSIHKHAQPHLITKDLQKVQNDLLHSLCDMKNKIHHSKSSLDKSLLVIMKYQKILSHHIKAQSYQTYSDCLHTLHIFPQTLVLISKLDSHQSSSNICGLTHQ